MFSPQVVEIDTHPLAILRMAGVGTAAAQVKVVDKTWYPHVWFHSAIWGRGSGSRQDAHPVADGAIPQVANWVAGFSMSFPAFDYWAVKAKKRIAIRNEQAERANYDLAIQVLTQKDAQISHFARQCQTDS